LKVTGNLIQSGGTIDIKGGKLYIEGDYRLQTENTDANGNKTYTYSNGYLKMTDSGSYVKVGGDFITQSQNSHEGYLTEGVLEVKGDFIQKRQKSGDKLQRVSFDTSSSSSSYSSINILEIRNTSEEGVEFTAKVLVTGEIIETTTPIKGSKNLYIGGSARIGWDVWPYDLGIEENCTLSKDITIEGNFYLSGGTLNLNQKSLTVGGNLIHSGGTLNINGGKLIVKGDYRIQKESVNAQGQITYGGSDGILHMTNENDYVCVEGNFVTQSYYSHNGRLTDGVLEVKGDFIQKKHQSSYAYRDNFYATGKHKTILSGEGLQKVSFEIAESRFNILELRN